MNTSHMYLLSSIPTTDPHNRASLKGSGPKLQITFQIIMMIKKRYDMCSSKGVTYVTRNSGTQPQAKSSLHHNLLLGFDSVLLITNV